MMYTSYLSYACKQAATIATGDLVKFNICGDMLADLLTYRDQLTALEVEALEAMYNKFIDG